MDGDRYVHAAQGAQKIATIGAAQNPAGGKPVKSIKVEAWGVKNKKTGMIIPRTYANKRQAELLIRNVEDVMKVIPVKIMERKK